MPEKPWASALGSRHGLLITHPGAAFYVRVSGDSMEGAGIFEGDVLVVDRALDTRENAIGVALVHGDTLLLMPENPRKDPLARTREMDFRV